jgi:hypothetical protein
MNGGPEAGQGPDPQGASDQQNAQAPRRDDASGGRPSRDGVEPVVAVTVIRTGGFAGLRRTWRAEAFEDDAPHWVTLIEGCPWDAAYPGDPQGADLFMWRLDARCGDRKREAELADPDVQGPWRELIDAVRDAGSPAPSRD